MLLDARDAPAPNVLRIAILECKDDGQIDLHSPFEMKKALRAHGTMLWLVAPGGCVKGFTCKVWHSRDRVSDYLERKGWSADPGSFVSMKRASDEYARMMPLPELYDPRCRKATEPAEHEEPPVRGRCEHETEGADVRDALLAYRDEIVGRMRSEGFTHRQIGQAFGVTDRTSKNWVARMRSPRGSQSALGTQSIHATPRPAAEVRARRFSHWYEGPK